MAPKSVVSASAALLKLLEPYTSEERKRLVKGAMMTLGESSLSVADESDGDEEEDDGTAAAPKQAKKGGALGDAQSFFAAKAPTGKTEELATAARFRELKSKATSHTRADMTAVFAEARRNFDGPHFARDIANARTAKLFNKGGGVKDGYTLSYLGQNYVDKLPDRAAAQAERKPIRKGAKRTPKKGAGKKKAE